MEELDDPIEFVEAWELTRTTKHTYGWAPPTAKQERVFLAKKMHDEINEAIEMDGLGGFYQCLNDGLKVPVPLQVHDAKTPLDIAHERKVKKSEKMQANKARKDKEDAAKVENAS